MVCPKCSTSLPDDTIFCTGCGTQVSDISPPPPPDYAQPQPDYAQQQPSGQQAYYHPYPAQSPGISKKAMIAAGAAAGAFLLIIFIVLIVSFAGGSKIVGSWEYVAGSYTYFFEKTSNIEFFSDGTVINSDYDYSGTWEADGNTLIIAARGKVYEFTITLDKDSLRVTDEDFDTGSFRRIR